MKNFRLFKTLLERGVLKKNISEANLSGANLNGANLNGADLGGADLRGADLRSTDLSDIQISERTFGIVMNCPEEGSFIGYKKADGKIVTLKILEDALRSSATTYKCRCSEALVLEIEDGLTRVRSDHDPSFVYTVNEIVSVNNFDTNRWNECSTGIHFFTSKLMAKNYN